MRLSWISFTMRAGQASCGLVPGKPIRIICPIIACNGGSPPAPSQGAGHCRSTGPTAASAIASGGDVGTWPGNGGASTPKADVAARANSHAMRAGNQTDIGSYLGHAVRVGEVGDPGAI